jgi:hypothetical protein
VLFSTTWFQTYRRYICLKDFTVGWLHFVPDSILVFTLTVGKKLGRIDVIILFVVTESVLGFRLIVGESVCIVIPGFILLGFKLAVGDSVLITFT